MFEVFARSEMLKSCLVNYLRVMDVPAMVRFYAASRSEEEQAMLMLKASLRMRGKEQLGQLNNVLELLKRGSSWKKDALAC